MNKDRASGLTRDQEARFDAFMDSVDMEATLASIEAGNDDPVVFKAPGTAEDRPTPNQGSEVDPQLLAAFEARWGAMMDEMSEAELRTLINPKTRDKLAREVWRSVVRDRSVHSSSDADPSVLTDAEWAIIATQPGARQFEDPAFRAFYEATLRADPAELKATRQTLADIKSAREAPRSAMVNRWIRRWVIVFAVIGGFVALVIIATPR